MERPASRVLMALLAAGMVLGGSESSAEVTDDQGSQTDESSETDPSRYESCFGDADCFRTTVAGSDTADLTEGLPSIQPAVVTPSGSSPSNVVRTCEDDFALDDVQLCSVEPSGSSKFALTGRVLDEATLEPVSGASVSLVVGDMTLRASTDALGQFAFSEIGGSVGGTVSGTLSVVKTGYGRYQTSNHHFEAGDGFAVNVLLTTGDFVVSLPSSGRGSGPGTTPVACDETGTTLEFAPTSTSEPASEMSPPPPECAQAAGAYSSQTRVPPTINISPVYSSCQGGSLQFSSRRYPWMFYVTHVLGPEVGGEIPKITGASKEAKRRHYVRANISAISNYAWKLRYQGRTLNNTSQFQCFLPGSDVRNWWPGAAQEALAHRVIQSGDLKLTEYKGYGAGDHDHGCDPPFIYGGTYQLSQVEARYCAAGGETWQWIINHYYDYLGATGSHIGNSFLPKPPTVDTTKPGHGKIKIDWTSTGAWRSKLQRFRRYPQGETRWIEVFSGGWRKTCRCIKTVTSDTGLAPGELYTYRILTSNPRGATDWVYFSAQAGS